MLHQCNIWCTNLIGEGPSPYKGSETFLCLLPFLKKNKLAKSVTFFVATVIGFLFSKNITYYKYNIYKAKSQGKY